MPLDLIEMFLENSKLSNFREISFKTVTFKKNKIQEMSLFFAFSHFRISILDTKSKWFKTTTWQKMLYKHTIFLL